MGHLELPAFYDPVHARRIDYRPDQQRVFEFARAAARAQAITPAGEDARDVHLLLIDVQRDFCFPEGTLYVGGRSGTGAVSDNARIAEFVYRNVGRLTNITTTLDTHYAYQIFFAPFWVDADGREVAPFREVAAHEVREGRLRPNPVIASWLSGGDAEWLRKQAVYYCDELEREGKYRLYLWPPHCLLGSDGHALAGVVHEARLFHAYARGAQSWCELKGGNPLTENYSVLRPEVLGRHDGGFLAEANQGFLDRLLRSDVVIVAGQASSHCVKSSVDDLLEGIRARDRALARRVYVLTDCMSAVAVPDGKGGFVADFTEQATAAQARWGEAGMNLVRSTDPMESWPGMRA